MPENHPPNETDQVLQMIYSLAAEGYDFTLTRNAELIDDGKCWVRFHKMGHCGISDGQTDIAQAIKAAHDQVRR